MAAEHSGPQQGCGKTARPFTFRGSRVVGGVVTQIEDYPHAVSITRNDEHECGGSIIDRYHVLSAAHCFAPFHPRMFKVRVGVTNTSQTVGGQSIPVDDVISHPSYDYDDMTRRQGLHDIAVIRLTHSIKWTDQSQPICLPEQSDQNVSGGTRVEVCGWGGHQSGGREGRSDQLHRANIQVVDEETCRQEYSFNSFHRRNFEELKDTTLCAGGREGKKVSDTCMGDSGGGLVQSGASESEGRQIIGIVSMGAKKCGVRAGIYTRVNKYTEWIKETIEKSWRNHVLEVEATNRGRSEQLREPRKSSFQRRKRKILKVPRGYFLKNRTV